MIEGLRRKISRLCRARSPSRNASAAALRSPVMAAVTSGGAAEGAAAGFEQYCALSALTSNFYADNQLQNMIHLCDAGSPVVDRHVGKVRKARGVDGNRRDPSRHNRIDDGVVVGQAVQDNAVDQSA